MEQKDAKGRIIATFAVTTIAVLTIFGCSLLMQLRAEVNELKDVLATKSDLVAIRTAGVNLSFEQDKCTKCHTERRFAGEHGESDELMRIVKRMDEHPNVGLTHKDMERVHASLTLLKCATCHPSEQIKRLTLLDENQQIAKIREMQRKPGSKISPDEVKSIQESFQMLVGF